MKLLKIGDLDMNGQPVIYRFLQATDCRHQQEPSVSYLKYLDNLNYDKKESKTTRGNVDVWKGISSHRFF